MKKIIFFSLIIIKCIGVTNAQSFQLHTGPVFPTGNLASNDANVYAGNATVGFNIGMKSYLPLSHSNLSLMFGVDFFFNGLTAGHKDYLDSFVELDDEYYYDEHNYPVYLNIPIMLGLNYGFPLGNEKYKIYGEAAIGYNYSLLTEDNLKYHYYKKYSSSYTHTYDMEDKIQYDSDWGLCYAIEGGFLLKWFRLGLRYNHLGKYNYKTNWLLTDKYREEYDSKEMKDTERIITNLQLVIGFVF